MQGVLTEIEIDGEVKPLREWAKIYCINPRTVEGRIRKGVEPKRALTAPLGTVFNPPKNNMIWMEKPKKLCVKCIYRDYFDHVHADTQVYCNYMYHAGHRRPCSAEGCKVFSEGPMIPLRRQKPFA